MPPWYTFIVMEHFNDKLPSNKVGVVFIIVVLVVVGTIFGSKIKIEKPLLDIRNVDLVVQRNVEAGFKSGDADLDGLNDWLEEMYRSDPKNADTDGDGTKDGEEVLLKRDPIIAGPNDKIVTPEDYFTKGNNSGSFSSSTVTSRLSMDLFGQYLNGKKDGALSDQEKTALIQNVSQKVTEDFKLTNKFTITDITSVQVIKESVIAYGEALSQETVTLLTELNQQKNLPEKEYLLKIGEIYKNHALILSKINVPSSIVETHLKIINNTYNTGVLYIELSKSYNDSTSMLILLSKQKVLQESNSNLYSMLAQYFKNNGIIFSTDTAAKFWGNY